MTVEEEIQRRHYEMVFDGFRAHASAAGLMQLIKELRTAGVLSEAAIHRIEDAIVDELTLSRPPRIEAEEFRRQLRDRLDHLLAQP